MIPKNMSFRRLSNIPDRSRSKTTNLKTILVFLGLAILPTGVTVGEESLYDLKYQWSPGETFSTAEVIRAEGTIGEGDSATPARFTARVIRNYKVGNPDPIRFPTAPIPLERRLESAECEISLGTQSLRFHFTPEKMEINGVPLWDPATSGSATGFLAPFFDARTLRISSRGVNQWEIARQAGLFKNPEPEFGTFSVGLETVSSLGGLAIPFVNFPNKKVNIGETWRREMDSPSLPESEPPQTSTSWLTQRFEYGLTGPAAENPEELVLHVLATADAHELRVMDVRKLIVPASFFPDEVKLEFQDVKSMPTPRPEEQQNLVFENYKRRYEGVVRFDPTHGRLVSSQLSGTLEMDAVSSLVLRTGILKTPLRVRLNVNLETVFHYPGSLEQSR